MKIFPAIDIINGEVVRLSEGKYDSVKRYELTPLDAAIGFAQDGAKNLHVVDLDGAKSGNANNAKTIEKIVLSCNMFVEVGGGIRSMEQISRYLDSGVGRIILGTIAIKDYNFVVKAVEKFGNAIAVGVDARNQRVTVNGWTETTEVDSIDFCKRLKSDGVTNVIYTDVSKDGMLKGTNLGVYKLLCQAEYPLITASGGITNESEINELKKIGVYAAILGKSLYEGKINLRKAICLAED